MDPGGHKTHYNTNETEDIRNPPRIPVQYHPILHALFDPAVNMIALWAEEKLQIIQKKQGKKSFNSAIEPYPYAIPLTGLSDLISAITGDPFPPLKTSKWYIHVPIIHDTPVCSHPDVQKYPGRKPKKTQLSLYSVPVTLYPYDRLSTLFKYQEELSRDYVIGDSLQYLFLLQDAAIRLVRSGHFKPAIRKVNTRYNACFVPSLSLEENQWLTEYADCMPPVCRFVFHRKSKRETVSNPHSRVVFVLTAMMQVIITQALTYNPPAIRAGAKMLVSQQNELAFITDLTKKEFPISNPDMEKWFATDMHTWLTFSREDQNFPSFCSCIMFQEPMEGNYEPWSISLHLQSQEDPSLIIPAKIIWSLTGDEGGMLPPAAYLKKELLSGLGKAVSVSTVIKTHLSGSEPDRGECTLKEATAFLGNEAKKIHEKGVSLLLPAWWTEQKARPKIEVKAGYKGGFSGKSLLGISQLISFDYQIALGDVTISPDEFWQAVDLKTPFVKVGGRWISCDTGTISKALQNFEKRYIKGKPTAGDLIRLSVGEDEESDMSISVRASDDWTSDLLSLIKSGKDSVQRRIPKTFAGTLRPYQEEGHAFLLGCTERGFGACLADDMGLGKTPQTIAWLLSLKTTDPDLAPALLVCPMSVVGNWEHEISRFAPTLSVWIHHGTARCKGDEFIRLVRTYDLIITTYHLVGRDLEHLSQVPWSAVILDEAQNIKNPQTIQSKSAKKIPAARRVALTGTPVENRLVELWSIMDFLNPGYLGSQHAFQSRYASSIEQEKDPVATAELRRLIRPFILRRMKTDKSIIGDLPEKMETRVYCSLTREQATLYQAVVSDMATTLDESTGIARKGAILRVITRLKQICNHPGLIAKDTSMRPDRSGKVQRVLEMLEEVCDVQDSALLFSQYATFATELATICKKHFSCPVLLLTGSTSRKQRENLIHQFQTDAGPAIFIISLKAGGTGLNLTAATHVFHIDRWWNPAVEDQATDRTYRIGQKRNVQVHLMIASGTLEERIDEMNQAKRNLAEGVLASGDDFLTSLSTEELIRIVSLRDTVFAGEGD